MRLRGASHKDYSVINKLVEESKFKLDPKHLECIMVVEDDSGELIAIGSLTTILECMFLVNPAKGRKTKVQALKMLMNQASTEVEANNYDSYHAFATNDMIQRILEKKYNFTPVKGKVLVKFSEKAE